MKLRTLGAVAALLTAMPAAALDVIASFTPTMTNTGNFAPVTALLTGLVEGINLGSNIGFSVTASPIAGTLGGGYTAGNSDFGTFGDDTVALIVTGGVVTMADFYWRRGSTSFTISKNAFSIPQIEDDVTFEYAESRDLDTFEPIPTSFTAVGGPAVPEPASWAMLIAGFGLVGAVQRRRAAALG